MGTPQLETSPPCQRAGMRKGLRSRCLALTLWDPHQCFRRLSRPAYAHGQLAEALTARLILSPGRSGPFPAFPYFLSARYLEVGRLGGLAIWVCRDPASVTTSLERHQLRAPRGCRGCLPPGNAVWNVRPEDGPGCVPGCTYPRPPHPRPSRALTLFLVPFQVGKRTIINKLFFDLAQEEEGVLDAEFLKVPRMCLVLLNPQPPSVLPAPTPGEHPE